MGSIIDIRGFPGYGISRDGRAWSNIPMGPKNGRPPTEWRPLKGRPSGDMGYLAVALRRDGRYHYRYIHELVLTHFVGPRPSPIHQGRHLDGNHLNNHVDNLAWGTPAENSQDKITHGTSGKGEKNSRAKLKDRQIDDIFLLLADGRTQAEIAQAMGVTPGHIGDIARGRKRRHAV